MQLQIDYCKFILGVGRTTSNDASLAELGKYHLDIDIKMKIIRYWFRLISLPDNDILRKSYNVAFELDRLGYTTWVTAARMILQKNGFNYVWLKQGIPDYVNSSEFFTKLTYSLTCQSEQLFFSKIWNDVDGKTTKLDFYRAYKDTYKFENYLDEIKNFKS